MFPLQQHHGPGWCYQPNELAVPPASTMYAKLRFHVTLESEENTPKCRTIPLELYRGKMQHDVQLSQPVSASYSLQKQNLYRTTTMAFLVQELEAGTTDSCASGAFVQSGQGEKCKSGLPNCGLAL